MTKGVHGSDIPDDDSFRALRSTDRRNLAADDELRKAAVDLQVRAERHNYTYQFEWCGVPVIRLPDDIVLLQEIVWSLRPEFIVETGVARGGGVLLDASLMVIAGLAPKVLGIDIQILPHARTAIESSRFASGIQLLEADSAGRSAGEEARLMIGPVESSPPGILILDSNHTHDHVLAELRSLAPLLPRGSVILVADTLVEEMPEGLYENRPWGRGNNPMTAVCAFLLENNDFEIAVEWNRRGLMSEIRDGVLVRTR
jgi:cephalosporin hydroxylase